MCHWCRWNCALCFSNVAARRELISDITVFLGSVSAWLTKFIKKILRSASCSSIHWSTGSKQINWETWVNFLLICLGLLLCLGMSYLTFAWLRTTQLLLRVYLLRFSSRYLNRTQILIFFVSVLAFLLLHNFQVLKAYILDCLKCDKRN